MPGFLPFSNGISKAGFKTRGKAQGLTLFRKDTFTQQKQEGFLSFLASERASSFAQDVSRVSDKGVGYSFPKNH